MGLGLPGIGTWYARRRCDDLDAMPELPREILEFAQFFVETQQLRHHADYNPRSTFSRGYLMKLVDEADAKLMQFERTPVAARRAFAAHVLFRPRRD